MTRLALVILCVAFPVAAGEPEKAVRVWIQKGGALYVQPAEKKSEWMECTLGNLPKLLEKRAKAHDDEMKSKGKSGYEALPGGVKGSKLAVILKSDPEVPWQHAQWWMMACAQARFRHLRIVHGDELLDVTLPVDRGINAPVEKTEIYVAIAIEGREEKPAEWHDGKVMAPTSFAYKFAAGETADAKAAAKWIADASKVARQTGVDLVGRLRASAKVPVPVVAAILGEYRAARLDRIEIGSTTPPSDEARKADRLPYPAADTPAKTIDTMDPEQEIVEEEEGAKRR